ncbi:hypothetical protein TIFTF001_004140 [Ficus carica]|uniref:RNA cytidine acetyltransferase n=1 Tax=Ficus carica TaxID=3494 RepID=A0AA88DC87_FICCA|nr:hypothetical protein TIFTF001_004140 [Ficus carica]
MRKKVDERIRTLIENGVKTRHRSMFVIVGDRYHDQVVNLHFILSKAVTKSRPSVLWCYKNKLELSSHKKKRAKQLKRLMQSGLHDREKVDPLSLFLETAGLTYCLYKDSERILGNTFGMCILQDVHERFRTESHSEAAGRFNERFLLSLASCKACIVMDDELNVLPISSHIKSITPVPVKEDSEGLSEAEQDLKSLKEELCDDFPVGPLIKKCCTLDQGKAVITFLDSVLDKTLKSTVACLASRGRGKSAALGLAIAGAIAAGYSNIFVTAPSPENLKTLFDFVCKGFDALDYKEHIDFDVVRSTNPEFKKATIRINVFKQHRQTIQYIQPHEHEKLSQVELLVIDEAAAIPLPVVKSLLGPYLVFLSSTVNGYEGTGRSLSLKLVQQLERQSSSAQSVEGPKSGYLFKKIELSESIRYASGDPVESWLHGLLCLDATNAVPRLSGLPQPSECELYYVNRDTLFSYHKESELFLQRMMALYVSSHYKNSPNDLQLMADAPAHHLFVLLGPVDESKNQLPDILCVIQVSLEGKISRKSALKNLSTGRQPPGDQIPWKFSEQYQDTVFPTFSGARIVRIATHPSAMKLGYGSQAVQLLTRLLSMRMLLKAKSIEAVAGTAFLHLGTKPKEAKVIASWYYEGQFAPISEMDYNDVETSPVKVTEAAKKVSLLEETIEPRKNLPHLLAHLRERKPEKLHYIGVSFGLTLDLLRFWRKHKFIPFFIGHTPSSVTGEHTCMVLKPLSNDDIETSGSDELGFLGPFYQDFRLRFIELLGHTFHAMEYKLAMSILDPKINFMEQQESGKSALGGSLDSIKEILSFHDMKRLEAYANNLVDYHMILDIARKLARLYFQEKLPVTISYAQASVLLCIGLQGRDISDIEEQMGLERQQILSLFIKAMKKFSKYLNNLDAKEIDSSMPRLKEIVMEPKDTLMEEDLNRAARQAMEQMNPDTEGALDPERLQQYAIGADFENALQDSNGKIPSGGLITVKSSRRETEDKIWKKRNRSDRDSKKKSKH